MCIPELGDRTFQWLNPWSEHQQNPLNSLRLVKWLLRVASL